MNKEAQVKLEELIKGVSLPDRFRSPVAGKSAELKQGDIRISPLADGEGPHLVELYYSFCDSECQPPLIPTAPDKLRTLLAMIRTNYLIDTMRGGAIAARALGKSIYIDSATSRLLEHAFKQLAEDGDAAMAFMKKCEEEGSQN